MEIRWVRIALASGIGTIAILLAVAIGYWGLHNYRIWRADGIWCILGNDEIGWILDYGEENCPEVLTF